MKPQRALFVLLFAGLPLIDVILLAFLGQYIGLWTTVTLALVSGWVGVWLALR